jgi:PDDEXK-like domain of unknown function (DUF3799)
MKSSEVGPGVHYGLSFEEYLSIDAINKSGLDALARSPMHFRAAQDKDTAAKAFGRAIHCAVLEPEEFDKRYAPKPTADRFPAALNTADQYKAKCLELGIKITGTKEVLKRRILEVTSETRFLDDIEAEHSKFQLLSEDEWGACHIIAAQFLASPVAAEVFQKGRSEVTIVWEREGYRCKARLDWLADDFSIAADLKSAVDASPAGFAKSCADYNYHRQADWYLEAVEVASGIRPSMFAFGVYEKEFPYASAFYFAGQDMLELGKLENRELFARYVRCKTQDRWPGYPEELTPVDFPAWRVKRPDYGPQPVETY